MTNIVEIYDKVHAMTGRELRGYGFHFVKDDYIYDHMMPDLFCYGSGCSTFRNAPDEPEECRAGDDGLVSTTCERYEDVSELFRDMIIADKIIARWFYDD